MPLPLLGYAPSSQNQRVAGYEIGGDEKPTIFTTENILSASDLDALIEAAYRQIFFHAFKSDREPILESQLRNGQLTVRDFIQGLLLSSTFVSSFYEKNNNYRFVEQCVQRILGRDIYSEREKIAWSIVVAQKGYRGFIEDLLNSDEYLESFGYDTVPYQRRRVLPGRIEGERPFNIKSPRYDDYHRNQLGFPQIVWQNAVRRFIPQEKQVGAGNPSGFLNMARSINAQGAGSPTPNLGALNYQATVPYRKL
ncbi:MAG: phycobilisome rod-core linker polypeptide [Cyanobacteria bacterium P01_H01_bin.121]